MIGTHEAGKVVHEDCTLLCSKGPPLDVLGVWGKEERSSGTLTTSWGTLLWCLYKLGIQNKLCLGTEFETFIHAKCEDFHEEEWKYVSLNFTSTIFFV